MPYFDNAATTKPCPEAVAAVNDALTENWGNPSSTHAVGNAAHTLLAESRRAVLKALGVRRETEGMVFFTGSGTEADNLALFGTVYAKNRPVQSGSRGRILITEGEHAAVENAARRLAEDGFEICRVPTKGGVLDQKYIEDHAAGAILASFMLVNNETGALYDLRRAFDTVKRLSPNAVTHTDAVQAFLKVRFTPAALGADLVTVSAHKIGGVKGVGALYAAEPILRAKKLVPVLAGGGQEMGVRSGTENLPGIAGFAAACRVGAARFAENAAAVAALRAELCGRLADIPEIRLNEPPTHTDGILSLTMPGIRSETVLNFLSQRGICISAGSACANNGHKAVSRALAAYGLPPAEADTTVRVSLSHENTEGEIAVLADALAEAVRNLQRVTPSGCEPKGAAFGNRKLLKKSDQDF